MILMKGGGLYSLYFMSYIVIVVIALMNLIMAVIVEGALVSAEEDKEVAKVFKAKMLEAALPKIKAMFIELDADGSGELDLEEGLSKIVCSDEPMDNIRARKQMQLARRSLGEILEAIPTVEQNLMKKVEEVEAGLKKDMDKMKKEILDKIVSMASIRPAAPHRPDPPSGPTSPSTRGRPNSREGGSRTPGRFQRA